MSADLLGDLAVNVMHGPPNSYFKNKYIYVHMSMHRQRMITFSLLIDAWFIRYLYILSVKPTEELQQIRLFD